MRLTANPISKAVHVFVFICWAISCSGRCFAEEKDAIQFEGNVAFTAQQLSDELNCNPEYVVAICTNQGAQSLATLVERLLALGYKASGYPNASISTQIKSSDNTLPRLLVGIKEGRQIKLGQVHVIGVEDKIAKLIRDQLTEARPKGEVFPGFVLVDGKEKLLWKNSKGEDAETEDPHWSIGKRANFYWTVPKIAEKVAEELETLGFVDTEFESSVDIKEKEDVVDLIVNIKRLGEKRTADGIIVQGVYGSEVKDLLELVELKEGDQCDTTRLQTIVRKLWESGRFSKHTARWHPEYKNCLFIEVEKVAGVPWLSEPLDEKALVILKLRDWLSGLTASDQDTSFVYKHGDQKMQVIVSRDGMYMKATGGAGTKLQLPPGETVTIMGDATGIIFDYEPLSQILNVPLGETGGGLTISINLGCSSREQFSIPGSKPDQSIVRSLLGFGATMSRKSHRNSLEWTLALNPSQWLPLAYHQDLRFQSDDNNLTVTWSTEGESNPVIVIDKKSGQIVKMDWDSTSLERGAGLFAAAREAVSKKPNAFDEKKPVTSLLAFVCQKECWELYQVSHQVTLNDNLRTAMSKFLEANCLMPLDELFGPTIAKTESESFSIPPTVNVPKDEVSVVFSYFPMKLGTLFPIDSWPRKIAATQALLGLGQQGNAHALVDQMLKDPSLGPVCHAVLAFCLRQNSHYRTSEVAAHGLKLLDTVTIGNDLQVLNSYLPEKWIQPPMNAIRSLSPEELTSINEIVPSAQVSVFLAQIHQSEETSLTKFWQAVGFAQGNFLRDTLKNLETFKLPPLKQNDRFASETKKPEEKKAADKKLSTEENIGEKYLR